MQRKSTKLDVQLAKSRLVRPKKGPVKRKQSARKSAQNQTPAKKKQSSLSQLLTPKNIQESLKSVTNLRSTVKNWLQYLIQADQVLDTLFLTSNSLKESGILDKLIKQKGKNLTTDDFTNVLIALMNTPIGSQLLKGIGKGSENETQQATETAKE